MDDVTKLIIEVSFLDLASGAIEKLGLDVDGLGSKFGVAGTAAGILGTAIAALGVTAAVGIGAAVDAATKLQDTIANVQVNTGATADDMERFKNNAQDLQSTVGANMDQMAAGFRQAFDVTKNVNIALAENTVATKDAAAAHGDAGQFTNALAVAMHEYQLDLDKATGQQLDFNDAMQQSQVTMGMLVMGARDANATLPQFTEFLSRASVEAAQMGVPLQDVEAGLASMSRHGYSIDQGATQLRGIFSHIQRQPTKAEFAELQKIDQNTEQALAKKYGTTDISQYSPEDQAMFSQGQDQVVTEAMGTTKTIKAQPGLHVNQAEQDFNAQGIAAKGLTGILADLTKQYDLLGYNDEQRSQSAGQLVTAQRGGIGLGMLLTKANADYNIILGDVSDTTKDAALNDEILATQQKTLTGQLADLRGEAQTFLQIIGAPMTTALTGWATGLNGVLKPIMAGLPDAVSQMGGIFAGKKERSRVSTGASPQDVKDGATQFQDVSPMEKVFDTVAHGAVIARDTVKTFFAALSGGWKDNDQIVGVTRVFGNIGTIIHDVLIPNFLTAVGIFQTAVIPAFLAIGDAIVKTSAFLREHEDLIRVALGIYASVKAGIFAYKEAMDAVGLATKAFSAVQTALNVIMSANPFVLAIAAIAALAVGFYELYTKNKQFHDFINANVLPKLKELGSWITGTAVPALTQFGEWLGPKLVSGAQASATFFQSRMLPILKDIGTWITGTAIPAISNFAQWLGPKLVSGVQATAEFMQTRFIPAVKGISEWITGTGLPALRNFADEVSSKISFVMGDLSRIIEDKVLPVLQKIGDWIRDNVLPQLRALGSFINDTIKPYFQAWGDLIATVLDGIDLHFKGFGNIFGGISDVIKGFVTFVGDLFSGNLKPIMDVFSNMFEGLGQPVKDVFLLIGGVIKIALDEWGPLIKGGLQIVLDIMHLVWDTMDNAVRVAWDIISTIINDSIKIVTDVIKLATDLIRGNWKGAWNDVKDIFSNIWDIIKTTVGDVMSTIGNTISNALATVKDVFGTALKAVGTMISNLYHDWVDVMGEVMDKLHEGVTNVWNTIKKDITSAKDLITNAILDPFRAARDGIGEIMTAFKDKMATPFNIAAKGITAFIGGIRDALSWVGDKLHIDIGMKGEYPGVPQFASGGKTPGGAFIAGEGGKELVVAPEGSQVFTAQETINIFKAINGGKSPQGAPIGDSGFLGMGAGPWDKVTSVVGDLAGDVAGGVRDFIANGAQKVLDLAMSAVHVPNIGGDGIFSGIGSGIMSTVKDIAIKGIQAIMDGVKSALPAPVVASGVMGTPADYPGGNAILDMAERTPGRYMWCEQFVGDVFQRLGLQYFRALDAETHSNMQPLSGGTPPVGAVVFYPWDGVGHVNIAGPGGSSFGTVPEGTGWRGPGFFGPAKGWTTNPRAEGGMIPETVIGVGLSSGQTYSFGEDGPEYVVPMGQGMGAGSPQGITYNVRAHTVAAHTATNAYGTTYNVAAHQVAAHTATRSQASLSSQRAAAQGTETLTDGNTSAASPSAISGTTNTLIDATNALVAAFQSAVSAVQSFVESLHGSVQDTTSAITATTVANGQATVAAQSAAMQGVVDVTANGGQATVDATSSTQQTLLDAARAHNQSLLTNQSSANDASVQDAQTYTRTLGTVQATDYSRRLGNEQTYTRTLGTIQGTDYSRRLGDATDYSRRLGTITDTTNQAQTDAAKAGGKSLVNTQDATQQTMLDAAKAYSKTLTDDNSATNQRMLADATAFSKTLVTTYSDAQTKIVQKVNDSFVAFTGKNATDPKAQQSAMDAQWWNSLTPAIQNTYKTNPITGQPNPNYGKKAFASGGVLTEPVMGYGLNSGMTYTLAESGREYVLNESQMSDLRSGGVGSDGIQIGQLHVHVAGSVLTDESLTMAVYNGLQRMKRRNGVLNLS